MSLLATSEIRSVPFIFGGLKLCEELPLYSGLPALITTSSTAAFVANGLKFVP
jgi:hypothetical protein